MNTELEKFIYDNRKFSWQPVLPVPENLWQSSWPWAPLILDSFDNNEILTELDEIDYLFVAHRDKEKISSYGHEGWYSITLHGISYDKTENFDRYGFVSQEEANYNWTDICEQLPNTINVIKSLPFNSYGRVRIMRLSPGGYIMPHTDGPGRIFGPCNFAISQPQDCEFVFENYGVVPFKVGRGFMLDIGIKHAIYNDSDQYRYHVIIHGEPAPNIHQVVEDSIKKL